MPERYKNAPVPHALLLYACLLVSACSVYDPGLVEEVRGDAGLVDAADESEGGLAGGDGGVTGPDAGIDAALCQPNDDPSCPLICPEVCDGKDNDCDDSIDEGELWADWGSECSAGVGECRVTGSLVCDESNPAGPLVCDAVALERQPEECDGKDNDCDETVDEGFPDTDEDGDADCVDEDDDGDGVVDTGDNCPLSQNLKQVDTDGDGLGDACDEDDDGDGLIDEEDNCPLLATADQSDLDGDGLGDRCDEDDDGDEVPDLRDNCPLIPNPQQTDTDRDGDGNDCDDDDDDDGVLDGEDNCPLAYNPNQEDADTDGLGDPCDGDVDGDGLLDGEDNCPLIPNPDQTDTDTDGLGNECDNDDDGDGIADDLDVCPLDYDPLRIDTDEDGIEDVCDEDDDDDGVSDVDDNCRLIQNPNQEDSDTDGQGDACDEDEDGDGVTDEVDNCPFVANPDQTDTDSDGLGNECDGDDDGDGIADDLDVCPLDYDPLRIDTDEDGTEDVCDEDDDNDGDSDINDCAPLDPAINHDAAEVCGDGLDNDCDTETDEHCRKKITINAAHVDQTLSNFPVLVSVSGDSELMNDTRHDEDVYFTDSDGNTLLSFEVESYNRGSGDLIAWVKIPSISSSVGTVFYLYYGDGVDHWNTANGHNETEVWGPDYEAVWHLAQDPGPGGAGDITDSSPGLAHATAHSSMDSADLVDAVAGKGIDFDGVDDSLTFTNAFAGTGVHTISAWVNQRTSADSDTIISFGADSTDNNRFFYSSTGSSGTVTYGFYANDITTDDAVTDAGWKHLAWTWDGSASTLYVDGSLVHGPDAHTGADTTGAAGVIGDATWGSRNLDGQLDEIRVQGVLRLSAWIKAEYENQRSDSTFLTIENE